MHRKLDGNASTFQQSDHWGLPGKIQLEVIYGHLAEAMLPQAATSI
jgi:hypothetical protein